MKTRSILMVLTLILVGGYAAHAQDLGAGSIKLILNGQTYGGTLVPPANAGPDFTWNLPAQSGTLALSSTGGWLVGGNGLLPTNPGLLGSTDNANVTLIAGGTGAGNQRITLLAGQDAVLLPTQTQLRLEDGAGMYSALVSPIAITPDGTNAGNITYVYPTTGPAGVDVRMKVKNITVSGNDRIVEFDWTNPNTTGQIGFSGSGTQTCTGNTDADVAGISFTVEPSSIYSFEVFLDVLNGCDADITFGTPGSNNDPAGATARYKVFNLTANGNDIGGGQENNVKTIQQNAISLLKGYIQTTNATPSGSVIVIRFNTGCGNGNDACITAKSAVQLVTE